MHPAFCFRQPPQDGDSVRRGTGMQRGCLDSRRKVDEAGAVRVFVIAAPMSRLASMLVIMAVHLRWVGGRSSSACRHEAEAAHCHGPAMAFAQLRSPRAFRQHRGKILEYARAQAGQSIQQGRDEHVAGCAANGVQVHVAARWQ
jgi:hypothetical protein